VDERCDEQWMYINIACNRPKKFDMKLKIRDRVKLEPNDQNIFEPAEGERPWKYYSERKTHLL